MVPVISGDVGALNSGLTADFTALNGRLTGSLTAQG